jgi:hypothetical protein
MTSLGRKRSARCGVASTIHTSALSLSLSLSLSLPLSPSLALSPSLSCLQHFTPRLTPARSFTSRKVSLPVCCSRSRSRSRSRSPVRSESSIIDAASEIYGGEHFNNSTGILFVFYSFLSIFLLLLLIFRFYERLD